MVSIMESLSGTPTPDEAAAALATAEAGAGRLADRVSVSWPFFVALGAAVAFQIGTFAAGVAGVGSPGALPAVGGAVLVVVVGVQLVVFRRTNGVWLGGFVSRVLGGTASAASLSYAAGIAAALWAALSETWWLVPVAAVAGGAGYALSGWWWMRRYRTDPAAYSRGESLAWLAVAFGVAVAGGALLVSLA